jgi:shikimate dehydrogenase
MESYAVMGNPVAHSKSPEIHRLFAEQTGEQLSYTKILVPPNSFRAELTRFVVTGGKGLNVTVPFKQQAWAAVDELSERAQRAEAVNTVLVGAQGKLFGDNTDGIGLVRDLRDNHRVELSQARVLLLGAGGAVRGVLPSVLGEIPAQVVIANRTLAKAEALAEQFAGKIPVLAHSFDALAGERFDVVINGTSASLSGKLPELPAGLVRDAVCYDMAYGDGPTAFVKWAQEEHAKQALDGLGMLVEQAAESFYLWRDKSPDTAPVIVALRYPQAGW